jgi:hypothetical protein
VQDDLSSGLETAFWSSSFVDQDLEVSLMKGTVSRSILAAIAIFFVAGHAHAQYYNVDFLTLPNGPIELEDASAVYTGSGWFLSGDAVDLSSQTFNNVKFLNEWMFDDGPSAFNYIGGGVWHAADGNVWTVPSPDGYLQASDTFPLPYADMSAYFPGPTAFVAPTDLLPYVNIGTISPGNPVPFIEIVSTSSEYDFDFVNSFISTTSVPEPSTLVLLGIGAIGVVLLVGKRRRSAAI